MKKRFLVLVIYCLPCIVVLPLLYEYRERTKKIAEDIKEIALYVNESERFIITADTIDKLKEEFSQEEVFNDVLKKLAETKDWNAKEEESFLNDLRELILSHLVQTPNGKRYSDLESKILNFAKTQINLTESSKISEEFEPLLKERNNLKEIINFFILQKKLKTLNRIILDIDRQVSKIWKRNSIIIILMVFLPYILLGFRLTYGSYVELSLDDRNKAARQNWVMKIVVACVIVFGWMYVLNPLGRGATTIEEYFIIARVNEVKTVPIYIAATNISHTIAGFLGWYLYLLLYFFAKLYQNDVKSGRVYRFLFGKFLFTYGIALTFTAVFGNETQPIMFLIGFFPLSAVSFVKEFFLNATKGIAEGKTGLSELPSISTWHILRLEEEGIDSIPTLACSKIDQLNNRLPNVMMPLVELWIDVAQLYTILGEERYKKIRSLCQTASEFMSIAKDPEFQTRLDENEVKNPQEVVNILNHTFKGKIIPPRQLKLENARVTS